MISGKKTSFLIGITVCMLVSQGCTKGLAYKEELESSYTQKVQTTATAMSQEKTYGFQEEDFFKMQLGIQSTAVHAGKDGFIEYQGNLLATTEALENVMGLVQNSFRYDENTCFFDKNGLLCIRAVADFSLEKTVCTVEKTYYYDQIIYTEKQDYDMSGQLYTGEDGQVYLPVKTLAEIYGYEFAWDGEGMTGTVSGGGRAAGSYQNKCYQLMAFDVNVGSYWSTSGKLMSASQGLGVEYGNQFVYTAPEKYIPVSEGEEFRMDFFYSWFPQVAGILFLDRNDQPVLYHTYDKSTQVDRQIVTVPAGAVKMHLSMYVNQTYRMEKAVFVEGAELGKIPKRFYQEQTLKMMKKNQENSQRTKQGEYTLDKAYITFVADDTRPDLDRVFSVFQEKKVPFCAASIVEHLPFVSANGQETSAEVNRRIQAGGGEILAHNEQVINSAVLNDFDSLFRLFYDNKQLLSLYGLETKGAILSGGTDLVRGSEITDMWVRQFYNYSDSYGVESLQEPYYHPRVSLDYHYQSYKELIDEAIAKKQWLVFYFHSLDEVGETQLREVLDYVNGKGKNRLEAVTYKELYSRMN